MPTLKVRASIGKEEGLALGWACGETTAEAGHVEPLNSDESALPVEEEVLPPPPQWHQSELD